MKRNIEVNFIEGDVVAQNEVGEKLLLSPRGIMIADTKGDEHFLCWELFLNYYSHLKTLEKASRLVSGIVTGYREKEI